MAILPDANGLFYPPIGKYTADLPSYLSPAEYARRSDAQYGNHSNGGSGGGSAGGENTTPFVTTESEPNNDVNRANFIPLGTGPSNNSTVTIGGTLNTNLAQNRFDVDYYAADLRAGDIINVELSTNFALFDVSMWNTSGVELIGTTSNQLFGIVPSSSPLSNVGPAVSFATIIPADGRYYFRVGDGAGSYTLRLKALRSTFEAEAIGTKQTLFLDFDGAIIDGGIFGVPGSKRLPSLEQTLEQFGFTSIDVDNLITATVARVKKNYQTYVATLGNNGYFNSDGIGGHFDIQILNSRDNADVWGNPNVSRVIVGGGAADLGISTRGIAQSVDTGNFLREETAVVTPEAYFLELVDTIPRAPTKTLIDVLSTAMGNTISHEAGHYFGARHQDSTDRTITLMDEGGQPLATSRVGVGPDGIFGTDDDIDVHFAKDRYSLAEGLTGVVNHAISTSFALSTGMVGATIAGTAYNDVNRNAVQNNGEVGTGGWLVFADSNNNSIADNGEGRAVTDASGNYSIIVGAGTYVVRIQRPVGWVASTSTEEAKTVTVSLNGKATANFGSVFPSTSATGYKWLDLNGDGIRDSNEPGLAGVYIYLDIDGDGRPDFGEPASISKDDGSYSLTPPSAGSFQIREVVDPGYVQTFPASGKHVVNFDGRTPLNGYDFGNRESSDWGDAPSPYPTTRAQNGASHGATPGLRLGTSLDAEQDGQPNADATGDDGVGPLNGTGSVINDEDGVSVLTSLVRGDTQNVIRISVTNTTGAPAYLQGWIDYNENGSWSDAGDQFITNMLVTAGNNDVGFTIPGTAVAGTTFARFRLSQDKDLAPTGRSKTGEVEDYKFTIVNGPRRNLQDDTFTVNRNSSANTFKVLLNDFIPPADPLTALLVGPTDKGASVSVSGTNILYTPPRGFFGRDSFTYTVVYASGKRESANVIVNVNLEFTNPVAIDDSFDIPTNSVSYPLNVLVNDLEGAGGALVVTDVSTPDKGGNAVVGSGGLSIRYSPRRGFGGTEQFTYTVMDGLGKISIANITVHTLEGDRLDDDVAFSFKFLNMAGEPITTVTQEDQFQVVVYVDDLRPERGALQTPIIDVQNPGVYAAYLDVLYAAGLVSPSNPVNSSFDFANVPVKPYIEGTTGSSLFPGVIKSLGGFAGNVTTFDEPDPIPVTVMTFTAKSAGIAEFVGDPANQSPNTDVVLYNVANTPVPTQQVRYGRSSLEIVPKGTELPFAVDDSPGNLGADAIVNIDVLKNDIVGSKGPISILKVTQPTNGQAIIVPASATQPRDMVRYVANTSAVGFTDQFTYTIIDQRGLTSTATVSVVVGDASANDKIKLSLKAYDLQGNAITTITVGGTFQLRGFVQDLRPQTSQSGVFAAFQDILYDSTLVSVPASTTNTKGFDITYSSDYGNGKSGDIRIPGLINEVGSFQTNNNPLGLNNLLQFTITMKASATGIARFDGDPADITPFHDSLVFSDQRNAVPFDQIAFVPAQITILPVSGGGGANGEGNTNPNNAFDVNNDGFVSPIDVLILVNLMNNNQGSGSGEGEGDKLYFDVDHDGHLTPLDALLVINALNSRGGSGEGESAAPALSKSSTASTVSVPQQVINASKKSSSLAMGPMLSGKTSNELKSLDAYLASIVDDAGDDDLMGSLATDILKAKKS